MISDSDTSLSDEILHSIGRRLPVVFETPLQFDELAHQVVKFRDAGYQVYLVQLYPENEQSSVIRVKQRIQKGGRIIETGEVRSNYSGNFRTIIKHHHLFRKSFFVDASNATNPVVAELDNTDIKFWYPVHSAYISELLYEIVINGDGNKQSLKILKSNKLYGELSYKKLNKALKLILRLKK